MNISSTGVAPQQLVELLTDKTPLSHSGRLQGFVEHFLYFITLGQYDRGKPREEFARTLYSGFSYGPSADEVRQFNRNAVGNLIFTFIWKNNDKPYNFTMEIAREFNKSPCLNLYHCDDHGLRGEPVTSLSLPDDIYIHPDINNNFLRGYWETRGAKCDPHQKDLKGIALKGVKISKEDTEFFAYAIIHGTADVNTLDDAILPEEYQRYLTNNY